MKEAGCQLGSISLSFRNFILPRQKPLPRFVAGEYFIIGVLRMTKEKGNAQSTQFLLSLQFFDKNKKVQ